PFPSRATSVGPANCADVAGPPSPLKPTTPLPATLVMMPDGEITRIRWLTESATYRFPPELRAMPSGPHNCAERAGPPSPFGAPGVRQSGDTPAIVWISPSGVTFWIRFAPLM